MDASDATDAVDLCKCYGSMPQVFVGFFLLPLILLFAHRVDDCFIVVCVTLVASLLMAMGSCTTMASEQSERILSRLEHSDPV